MVFPETAKDDRGMTIYERMLSLPLFQGMNKDDLTHLAGHTKFDFCRVEAGKVLVKDGEACTFLCFLMKGMLRVSSEADDHSFMLVEELKAPAILQPERIFGLYQRFSHTFTTTTPCNCLFIQKSDVVRIAEENAIFRINLLNMISTQSQRLCRNLWHQQPDSLQERIVRFIESRSLYPAGHKSLHIKMTRLAHELNDSRLDISRALNAMQDAGLLALHRGCIEIPALERLINHSFCCNAATGGLTDC